MLLEEEWYLRIPDMSEINIYNLDHTQLYGFSVIAEPFGRVPVLWVDVLQRNREVDVEKIEIFETPVL
jgi:hypothetical protein